MSLLSKNKESCFLFMVLVLVIFHQPVNAQDNTGETETVRWKVEPFYKYRKDGKPGRGLSLSLKDRSLTGPVTVKVVYQSITETTVIHSIDTGNNFSILLPQSSLADKSSIAQITIISEGKEFVLNIPVQPIKQWKVFIYPHSHVDIGYTGLQEDVEKIHVRNIDVGIDIAKKTANYPEGARFIWNTESTWVVNAYLKKATASQKQSFIEAVRKNWIRIDAGHSNMNTTTCSDEEILRFFKNSNEIERQTKVPVTTMVQMDVPGAAWGLVQAAAQNGVKGFISFPNNYDLRKIFEHKPFYWKGPDGKSRILFIQGFPYGIGYTIKGSKYGLSRLQTYSDEYDRVSTKQPLKNFIDAFIFKEINSLERLKSPYEYFVMTWSMADNCVIDADLPEAVKEWNSIYANPKLEIAGSEEILSAYEKNYGNIIPEYSGDFTEFWTNGLGSDAAHVGMGRKAKENLVQAETFSVMVKNDAVTKQRTDSIWENILLSAEHTWGYQNPKEPLAKVIEKRKAAFFSDAEEQSISLLNSFSQSGQANEHYAVVNTLSWDRNGIVCLNKEQSRNGDKVIELSTGKQVASQRLSTGELIFYTNKISALSSMMYKVVKGSALKNTSLKVSENRLENDILKVSIDPITGNIRSVVDKQSGYEYVSKETGLNSFHYLPGVFNGKDKTAEPSGTDSVIVTIKEKGPLVVSLLVRSKATGTNWLEREISLYSGQGSVHLKNTFDKISTRTKEGIHFGFAFNLKDPLAHVDAPWSIIKPEENQLKGANRNWMTFQRWVNISNANKAVTWTAIESPLIEWGEMSGTILDGARQFGLWKKHLASSSVLYSWPLNNHWDTNFPLEQGGLMTQEYAVLFHDTYDVVKANRFGTERHRPLLVISSGKNLVKESLVRINNPRIVLSTLKKAEDQKGMIVRLRSFSDKAEQVKLDWPDRKPQKIQKCLADEIPLETAGNEFMMLPFGTENFYVTF